MTTASLAYAQPHEKEATMSVVEMCAQAVLECGHAVVPMPNHLDDTFRRLITAYEAVEEPQRSGFSFPERDDGFLPFGTEYAVDSQRPDLCRRFNFWHANAAVHSHYPFVAAPLYMETQTFEARMHGFAQDVLEALARRFPFGKPTAVRMRSYLQLCDYTPALRNAGREFMQDPHEDGHLLTIVKSTTDGLVILDGLDRRPVRLGSNEMIVFAGSLLTELTDGCIAAVTHAVVAPPPPGARKSLMYFVNPDAARGNTWTLRRNLDLDHLVNQAQTRFGKPDLKVP